MAHVTTDDGTQIFYKDWGNGPPVLFSHGWPLSSDSWESQMLFLAANGCRSVAHDRRGHGRSSQTWDGNEMDTYADDLATVIERLDLRDRAGRSRARGVAGRCMLPQLRWRTCTSTDLVDGAQALDEELFDLRAAGLEVDLVVDHRLEGDTAEHADDHGGEPRGVDAAGELAGGDAALDAPGDRLPEGAVGGDHRGADVGRRSGDGVGHEHEAGSVHRGEVGDDVDVGVDESEQLLHR